MCGYFIFVVLVCWFGILVRLVTLDLLEPYDFVICGWVSYLMCVSCDFDWTGLRVDY